MQQTIDRWQLATTFKTSGHQLVIHLMFQSDNPLTDISYGKIMGFPAVKQSSHQLVPEEKS